MSSNPWKRCERCGDTGWRYALADGKTGWRCVCGAHRPDQPEPEPWEQLTLDVIDKDVDSGTC